MLKIKSKLGFVKSQGSYLENKDHHVTVRDLIKWSYRI